MEKKCDVCGDLIPIVKENIYKASENYGLISALTAPSKVYDVTDCPNCGCQTVLKVRMSKIKDKEEES